MQPDDLKNEFDSIADSFIKLSVQLEFISEHVSLNMDKKAISEVVSNLHWAAENSTIIGLHQINEALDDNMGTGTLD